MSNEPTDLQSVYVLAESMKHLMFALAEASGANLLQLSNHLQASSESPGLEDQSRQLLRALAGNAATAAQAKDIRDC